MKTHRKAPPEQRTLTPQAPMQQPSVDASGADIMSSGLPRDMEEPTPVLEAAAEQFDGVDGEANEGGIMMGSEETTAALEGQAKAGAGRKVGASYDVDAGSYGRPRAAGPVGGAFGGGGFPDTRMN